MLDPRTPPCVAAPEPLEIRPERGTVAKDKGHSGDGALRDARAAPPSLAAPAAISSPLANFGGISNLDNFNLFGFRVNPPDPVGDVGPNPTSRW